MGRVTAPIGLGQRLLAPAAAEFMVQHPKVTLDLVFDDHSIDLVAHRFDIALRAGWLPDSSFRSRRLARLSMVLCASPRYLQRAGTPSKPADLVRHTFIGFAPLGQALPLLLTRGRAKRQARVHSRVCANDGEALRVMAKGDVGLTVLPRFWVDDDLADGSLVCVLPEWHMEPAQVHALHTHGANPPQKVTAFIQTLAERASERLARP